MQTVGDIVKRVSTLLADQGTNKPYLRWSKEFLLDSMTEALGLLRQNRPDAFAETMTITLVPGSEQTLEDGELASIKTSGEDTVSESEEEAGIDLAAIFASKTCSKKAASDSESGTANIKSFQIDADDPTTFYVEPEIPEGQVSEVKAVVLTDPPCLGLGDMPKDFPVHVCHVAAIVEWMLYRALGVDSEDQDTAARAARHYRNFFDMLRQSYRQESRYGSGYYLGEKGDGDANASRR